LTGRLATRGPALQQKHPAGTHATLGWDPEMLQGESNLPEVLQRCGYRTGIIGKWHNGTVGMRRKEDHPALASYEKTRKV
jgi:arylsulfatase A-like enzyme